MKIRSIFYHLKQGFKNIYRNRLFSLASIATIAACVFLFGVFYSIMMNFEYMVKKAENEVCVTVFFDEGLSDTEIKKLGDTISNRVEVSSVHYTSAEEAWNNFKSEYFAAYPDLAEGFKDNPLINSASYEVYLSDAGMQGLVEGMRGAKPRVKIEPPLIMYSRDGGLRMENGYGHTGG